MLSENVFREKNSFKRITTKFIERFKSNSQTFPFRTTFYASLISSPHICNLFSFHFTNRTSHIFVLLLFYGDQLETQHLIHCGKLSKQVIHIYIVWC